MRRFLFFFIIVAFVNSIQAQDLQFEENCVLFQDVKTSAPVLILRDSILYKGNPLVQSNFKHTSYPDQLVNYTSYSIKGRTFLVQNGGGPVLEFRNDSIVACNKTPKFQNQYSAAVFVYNNELHFFGGYGLFTYKNIVTKYDAKNKDWTQVQTFGDAIPCPRSGFYSYRVNENLYVFGGIEEDPANFPNYKKCDGTVWRLHLPTMHWYKMGKIEASLLTQNTFLSFPANGKLYLISINNYGLACEVDLVKNTIKKFTTKSLIQPTQIYFDTTQKELVCVTWTSNGKCRFFHAKLDSFLGKPIGESAFILPFYKEPTTASYGFGFLMVLIALGYGFYFKKYKKNNLLPFNGIVFKKETGSCYYRNKPINHLEEPELRILQYLIANATRFVPLNELNRLFDTGNTAENFLSIVKRRELSFAELAKKLSTLTNIPEKDLLENRKNPEDRRIKEIRIAPSFLRIK